MNPGWQKSITNANADILANVHNEKSQRISGVASIPAAFTSFLTELVWFSTSSGEHKSATKPVDRRSFMPLGISHWQLDHPSSRKLLATFSFLPCTKLKYILLQDGYTVGGRHSSVKDVVSKNEARKVDNGLIATATNTKQHSVATWQSNAAGDTADVLHCLLEQDQIHHHIWVNVFWQLLVHDLFQCTIWCYLQNSVISMKTMLINEHAGPPWHRRSCLLLWMTALWSLTFASFNMPAVRVQTETNAVE